MYSASEDDDIDTTDLHGYKLSPSSLWVYDQGAITPRSSIEFFRSTKPNHTKFFRFVYAMSSYDRPHFEFWGAKQTTLNFKRCEGDRIIVSAILTCLQNNMIIMKINYKLQLHELLHLLSTLYIYDIFLCKAFQPGPIHIYVQENRGQRTCMTDIS
jgi:hypothetical protein